MRAIMWHLGMLPVVILMKNTSARFRVSEAVLAEMKATWYYRSVYENLT